MMHWHHPHHPPSLMLMLLCSIIIDFLLLILVLIIIVVWYHRKSSLLLLLLSCQHHHHRKSSLLLLLLLSLFSPRIWDSSSFFLSWSSKKLDEVQRLNKTMNMSSQLSGAWYIVAMDEKMEEIIILSFFVLRISDRLLGMTHGSLFIRTRLEYIQYFIPWMNSILLRFSFCVMRPRPYKRRYTDGYIHSERANSNLMDVK